MELADRHVVITGGGSGIGRALARRIAAERASAVVVADIDQDAAEAVALEVGGVAVETDVGREADIHRLVSQGVRTPMLQTALEDPIGAAPLVAGGVLEPEQVADVVIAGIREERFLILPHEAVAQHMALKAARPERWLEGMRKLVRDARGPS
jgi:NAD(P)-dependent dehydrogenase (short-subunit alcohol dehydrogenase family)